ncbi:SDR family NAD(P)-dependent oxidoreductase, partial [Streptomyces sp. NPDC059818]|uniref:type I polyketide synthase n=1 Tax=Streptomyces sp. NPDC059818 TaxID=3346962 RepID=UPI003662120C
LGQWPPVGAVAVDLEGFYSGLAEGGLAYGPVFQGMGAAWRRGEELFAEIALPEGVPVSGFGVHPALLDSALHVLGLGLSAAGEGLALPFAWGDVVVHASGASVARVRVAPERTGEGVSVVLADAAGGLIASVGSLVLRNVSAEDLAGGSISASGSLFGVEWVSSAALPGGSSAALPGGSAGGLVELGVEGVAGLVVGGEVPPVVVVRVVPELGAGGVAGAARGVVAGVLGVVQEWLGADVFLGSRLVVVTERAVDAGVECGVEVVAAGVWGLVRVVQSENPGRVVLADVEDLSSGDLMEWLGAGLRSGEPQFAVRSGQVRVPRLTRVRQGLSVPAPVERSVGRAGTVLVTGASGALGGLVARHLAGTGQAERLLLVSRRGIQASGMPELVADIEQMGVEVTVAACDLAERQQLAGVLDGVALTGVVHAAGVLDDGVVGSLTAERLEAVMRPKVDAAWNLHELTSELGLDLDYFTLFSSIAGVIGNAGQANYAAGNTFLDALAAHRRHQGLPAVSLAWGPWEQGMAGELGEGDRQRMARQGVRPLSDAHGLALLDAATSHSQPLLVVAHLDPTAIHAAGETSPLLSGLVRGPRSVGSARRTVGERSGGDPNALSARLAGLGPTEQQEALQDMIRTQTALVLGMSGPGSLDANRAFRDVGFDSLTAVELRNRLNSTTGQRLPATAVFDYPTPAALADFLRQEMFGTAEEEVTALSAYSGLDRLEASLTEIMDDDAARARVTARLKDILSVLSDTGGSGEADDAGGSVADTIHSASDDDMFDFIDKQLGL